MSDFNFGFNPEYLRAGGSVTINLRWGTAPFTWWIESNTLGDELVCDGSFALSFETERVVDHSDSGGDVTGIAVMGADGDGHELQFLYSRVEAGAIMDLHQLWQANILDASGDAGTWRDTTPFESADIDDFQMVEDNLNTTSRDFAYLMVDSDSNPHVISWVNIPGSSGTINHRWYTPADGWQTENLVEGLGPTGANTGINGLAAVIGSDNTIHIVYTEDAANDLYKYIYGTAGSWTGPSTIDTAGANEQYGDVALAIDRSGTLHLIVNTTNTADGDDSFLGYYSKTSGGAWSSESEVLDGATYTCAWCDSDTGGVAILCDDDCNVYFTAVIVNSGTSKMSAALVTNASGSWAITEGTTYDTGGGRDLHFPKAFLDFDGNFCSFFAYDDGVGTYRYYVTIFSPNFMPDENFVTYELKDLDGDFDADAYFAKFMVAGTHKNEFHFVHCNTDDSNDELYVDIITKSVKGRWTKWIFNDEWDWDVDNNKATIDGTQTSSKKLTNQIDGLELGKYTKLELTIDDYVAGSVSINLGSTSIATDINSDGDYEYEFVNEEASGVDLEIVADSSFNGSITSVSLKQYEAPYWLDDVTTSARQNTLNAAVVFPSDVRDLACTLYVEDADGTTISKVISDPAVLFSFESELVVDHSDDSGAVSGTPVEAAVGDGDEVHFLYTRVEGGTNMHAHQLWQTDRDAGDWRDTQDYESAEIDDYQMSGDTHVDYQDRRHCMFLVDSDHKPHVISYVDTQTTGVINHRYYDDASGWQTEDVVDGLGHEGLLGMAAVIDSDDVIHIVYVENASPNVCKYVKGSYGSWDAAVTIDTASSEEFHNVALAIDSDKTLHLFMAIFDDVDIDDSYIAYYSKTEHGAWSSDTEVLKYSSYKFELEVGTTELGSALCYGGYVYLAITLISRTTGAVTVCQVTNASGSWVTTMGKQWSAHSAELYSPKAMIDDKGNLYAFFLYAYDEDYKVYVTVFSGTSHNTLLIEDISDEFEYESYFGRFALAEVYYMEPVLIRCAGDENKDENGVMIYRRTRI